MPCLSSMVFVMKLEDLRTFPVLSRLRASSHPGMVAVMQNEKNPSLSKKKVCCLVVVLAPSATLFPLWLFDEDRPVFISKLSSALTVFAQKGGSGGVRRPHRNSTTCNSHHARSHITVSLPTLCTAPCNGEHSTRHTTTWTARKLHTYYNSLYTYTPSYALTITTTILRSNSTLPGRLSCHTIEHRPGDQPAGGVNIPDSSVRSWLKLWMKGEGRSQS